MRIAAAFLILLLPAVAAGVLIDSADGAGNTTTPPYSDPGVLHVGTRGSLSAVYLGNGVVMTAHHVGAGDVVIGGTLYPMVPGSELRLQNGDGSTADVLLFAIEPRPALPSLAIAAQSPSWGEYLFVLGNGRNRGAATSWDPNGQYPPSLTGGYLWAPGNALRWGTNNVDVFPSGRVFGTEAFGSLFHADTSDYEAQAVTGDSGGAAFTWDAGWKLSGLIIAIVEYSGQPASTTYYGQTTYYADLAEYHDDIVQAVALPEPKGGLWAGVLLVALLRRRRAVGE